MTRTRGPRTATLVALGALAWLVVATPVPSASVFTPDTLDSSWAWALYAAARRGLHFGSGFVFTYGPLGFLDHPATGAGEGAWLAGVACGLAAQVVVAVLLFRAVLTSRVYASARRVERVALLASATVVAVDVLALGLTIAIVTAAALVTVRVVEGDAVGARSRWVWCVGPPLAFVALVKTSFAPLSVALLLVLVVAAVTSSGPVAQRVALAAGLVASWALSLVGLWLLAGQSLGDLAGYARLSWQIVEGYPDAAVLVGHAAQVIVVAVVLLAVVVAMLGPLVAGRANARAGARGTVLATAVVVAFAATFWKEGVTRQDPTWYGGPVQVAFVAAAIVALVAVSARSFSFPRAPAIVAVVVICALASLESPDALSRALSGSNVVATVDGLRDALDPGALSSSTAAALAAERRALDVPASMVSRVGAQRVAVLPQDLVIGPAYGLNEVLLPDPQLYQAYTPVLDRLDATFLARRRVPWVLLEATSGFGSLPPWSAPATYRVLTSDYAPVALGARYVLLRWSPHRVVELRRWTRHGAVGSWWAVPACPGGTVTASFSLSASPAYVARSLVFRPSPVDVSARVGGGASASSVSTTPLIWRVGADGLNTSTYALSSTPWLSFGSVGLGHPHATALRVDANPSWFANSSDVRVDFRCYVTRASRAGVATSARG
ncbi:MAG: hypothetical protein ACRDV0_01770 [Acidimicrobiales bacterium]